MTGSDSQTPRLNTYHALGLSRAWEGGTGVNYWYQPAVLPMFNKYHDMSGN